jgi:opacity protein-like surface antigen
MNHPRRTLGWVASLVAMTTAGSAAAGDGPPKPRLWLAGSYIATTWSKQVPWQHGMGFGARYQPTAAWHVGLGYEFMGAATVDTPTLSLQVARHPFELNAGYALSKSRFMVGAELAFVLDQVARTTEARGAATWATTGQSHTEGAFSPRLRLGWQPADPVLLFISVGAELLLNRVVYVDESSAGQTVTSPSWVRARLEVGVAFDGW